MNIKRIIRGGFRFLTDSDYRFLIKANRGLYNDMPDEEYLKKLYKAIIGKAPDFENPRTFNEKLQWIKLYYRNPLYTVISDKFASREYVREKIGEEYLVPLLGVWDSPDEIDFEALPDEFVLKCNHNSGIGMCICRDKSKIDVEKVKADLRRGLNENFYLGGREWQYKNIKRRIVCEKYMSDGTGRGLLNYKIYCFNGEPKIFHMSRDIGRKSAQLSFLDENWNVLPFHREDYPPFEVPPEKPENIEELLGVSRKLSQDFPFVRVDLYVIDGKIYYSELTLDPCGGFSRFNPSEWDLKLGEWLTLPEKLQEVE